MQDIVMPKMGHDVTEGKLLRWTKRVGEAVTKGETIAEVEADKVNLDIEAPATGVLHALDVAEGATAQVGARLGWVASAGDSASSATDPTSIARALAPQSSSPPTTNAPPTSAPTPAPASSLPAPAPVPVFSNVAVLDAPLSTTAPNEVERTTHDRPARLIRATPLARRLAEEHGVNLAQAIPTGPGGRVVRDDVLALAPSAMGSGDLELGSSLTGLPQVALADASPSIPAGPALAVAPAAVQALPAARPFTPETDATRGEAVPLSRLQQTIARRMVESKTQAPHFYLTVEVDVTDLLALRSQLNAAAEDGVRVSVNDLVVKATAKALTRFPMLNASFAGDHLVLHDEISIAIAVALDDGLVTPVVRHADEKALGQIALEARGLAARARAGKSKPADYEGGTFTISNLGMFHIETFVAIINPPQVGILAVGAVKRRPVYEGDVLVPRDMMSMTLSADHRVTDGATGARFLSTIRALLEHPLRLLM